MTAFTKSKKGTSLVEVMVAVLIFMIVILGASFLFFYGRTQIDVQENRRVALQLAAQRLEELKAGNYDDIIEGETVENLTLEDLSYTRTTETEDVGSYKNVNVIIQWERRGKVYDVSLATVVPPES